MILDSQTTIVHHSPSPPLSFPSHSPSSLSLFLPLQHDLNRSRLLSFHTHNRLPSLKFWVQTNASALWLCLSSHCHGNNERQGCFLASILESWTVCFPLEDINRVVSFENWEKVPWMLLGHLLLSILFLKNLKIFFHFSLINKLWDLYFLYIFEQFHGCKLFFHNGWISIHLKPVYGMQFFMDVQTILMPSFVWESYNCVHP